MRKLKNIEWVKRWLLSGKTLTRMQCIAHIQYMNLPDAVFVLKARGMDIVNLNKRPKYGKYKLRKDENTLETTSKS